MTHAPAEAGFDPQFPIFLPALQDIILKNISNNKSRAMYPGAQELNWFRPDNEYWSYCAGLYSLGQSDLDLECKDLAMIKTRDRSSTILVADSGGYQIGRGTFAKQKYQISREFLRTDQYDQMRAEVLAWMETYADYAVIIDFPAWALGDEKFILPTYDECLSETKRNMEFFRDGHDQSSYLRFLSVIQGRYFGEALHWYKAVRDISGFPYAGWAFAGPVAKNPIITLQMILTMWRDGRLTRDIPWIHMLGRGSLSAAFVYNVFQQCINKYVSNCCTISYDVSSPSFNVKYGLIVTHAVVNSLGMAMKSQHLNRETFESFQNYKERWLVWESPFAKDIDFDDFFNGDSERGLDTKSYAIMAHHNTHVHVRAVGMINLLSNLEDQELIHLVPAQFVKFRRDVHAIFEKFNDRMDIRRLPISPDYANLIR